MAKTTSAQRTAKQRKTLKAKGLCCYCRLNKVTKGTACDTCKERRRKWNREYVRKRKVSLGLGGLSKAITEALRDPTPLTEEERKADRYCHSVNVNRYACGGGYRVMR